MAGCRISGGWMCGVKRTRLHSTCGGSRRGFRGPDTRGLRSQLTRAAESVPSNIVEGCFAASQKEFARYLEISVKSAGELEYHLQLAYDYGVLRNRNWQSLTANTVEVRRMLLGLRKKVLAPPPKP